MTVASRRAWPRTGLLLVGCSVAAQLVVLQLVLRTPFLGDDSPNQAIRGYIAAARQTIWSFVWTMTVDQWNGIGRFTPLGLLENYGLQDALHDRVVYKALLIAVTILATLIVARLLTRLSVPGPIALLGATLTSVLWQLHTYHDALMSYAGLTQLIVLAMSASALLFLSWLRRGGWWRLLIVVVLVALSNLTYEAAYPLVLLHVAVVIAERKAWWKALPPVAVTFVFVLLTFVLRSDGSAGSTSQYSLSLSPTNVLPALGKQLVAAFPAGGWLDPTGVHSLAPTGAHTPYLRGLLVGALMLPVLLAAARVATAWRPGRPLLVAVAIIVVALFFLPAGMVALAPRYQNDLHWGSGYLPLPFSVIALGIAVAMVFVALAKRIPRIPLAIVFSVLAVIGVAINAEGNTRVVNLNQPLATSRDELEQSFRAGLFDRTADNTMLLLDADQIRPPAGPWIPGYGWFPSNWFYTHTHRWFRAIPLDKGTPSASICTNGDQGAVPCEIPARPIDWMTAGTSPIGRWIILTPLGPERLAPKTNLYSAAGAQTAQLAIRTESAAIAKSAIVEWVLADNTLARTPPTGLHVARQEGGWSFVDVAVPAGAAAASARIVNQAAPVATP